ncbi:MAG TPA: ribosome silencing factor [Oligoflexus sp.]|uniref:ribosome silencing factor n=1 Tax=Oligoflexus sp. TaxID=1971216 RepID=UPI002D2E0F47|nr:ribosome silencing factor [Oligoflexus sp.]HYX39307.1 ribosome silencing factor [Oligoflexus sp.]
MESKEIIKLIANAAGDKKATRIAVQRIEGKSSLCDYQVICSGSNERQTQAIAGHIEEVLREKKAGKPLAIEGKQTGHWILMDYGHTMVHIFLDSIRDYYALERLWPDADTTFFD